MYTALKLREDEWSAKEPFQTTAMRTSYAIASERMPIRMFRGEKHTVGWWVTTGQKEKYIYTWKPPQTYVTDPVNCSTQPFPFQHAHAPKKERDGDRTKNRLIQIHLITKNRPHVGRLMIHACAPTPNRATRLGHEKNTRTHSVDHGFSRSTEL